MAKLTFEALPKHLQGPLAPTYLLHGNEPLFLTEGADSIRAAARRDGFHDREVLVVDRTFRKENLQNAAMHLSLFSAKKLLEIRLPEGKADAAAAALQEHVEKSYPGMLTLILVPDADWRVRKAQWFKTLLDHSTHVSVDTLPLADLPRWIGQRLHAQGQSAPVQALELIAQQVEGNLLGAHWEVLKLGLLHPPGAITFADISAAVTTISRYESGQIKETLLAGDFPRCARILAGLREEAVPITLLLWQVIQLVRTLTQLAQAHTSRQSELLMKLVPFRPHRPIYENAARRLPVAIWHQCLHRSVYIDRMSKGLEKGDPWDELLRLCERLCRKQASPHAA